MDRLLPFDELNILRTVIENIMTAETAEERRRMREYMEDEIEELLILSYLYGNEAGNWMLGEDIPVTEEKLSEALYRKIAGLDWKERIENYILTGTADDIMRVVETDALRIYNDAVFDIGLAVDYVIWKEWETMKDDRVRDSHWHLQGMKVPLKELFFTYDGDFAERPGMFQFAENNVNCRCRLRLSKTY